MSQWTQHDQVRLAVVFNEGRELVDEIGPQILDRPIMVGISAAAYLVVWVTRAVRLAGGPDTHADTLEAIKDALEIIDVPEHLS